MKIKSISLSPSTSTSLSIQLGKGRKLHKNKVNLKGPENRNIWGQIKKLTKKEK